MAIAWYVEEAQRLLDDQQRRAESLRTRGSEIAGFGAAVLVLIGGNAATIIGAAGGAARMLIGVMLLAAASCMVVAVAVAIWGVIKPRPFATLASDEIKIYISDRFLQEPDLWRIHLRSLRALEKTTGKAQKVGKAAAGAIMISLYALLAGLGFTLISLATLILELM